MARSKRRCATSLQDVAKCTLPSCCSAASWAPAGAATCAAAGAASAMTAVAASVVLIASLIMVSSGASADLVEATVCLSSTCRKGNSTVDPSGGCDAMYDPTPPD